MIKKALTIIGLACSLSLAAQTAVGDWQVYPMFNDKVDELIDTGDKLFYMSAGTLYSYDTANDETYVYSTRNKLSDSNIVNIYQNIDKGYIFIVYKSGNFDLLYNDGRVVNLPDLKDTNNVTDKTVNYVSFGKDRIYVATTFGIIIYDDRKHEVVESGIYNRDVKTICELNDHIILFADKHLWVSPKSVRHNTFDKFEDFGGFWATDWRTSGSNNIFYVNNHLYCTTIDFNKKSVKSGTKLADGIKKLADYADGIYAIDSANKVHLYNSQSQEQSSFSIPSTLSGDRMDMWHGASKVWFGSGEGICSYDLSQPTPTLTSDRYKPEAFTCQKAALINISADNQRIYFTNMGVSQIFSCAEGDGYHVQQTTNRLLRDGTIEDVSIEHATYRESADMFVAMQKEDNTTKMLGGPTRMVEDLQNPNRYYICNGLAGVFVVEGNQQIALWDKSNMPVYSGWLSRVYNVTFDPEGNLWVGHWNGSGKPVYSFLTPDKLRLDPATLTISDWKPARLPNTFSGGKDMMSVFSHKTKNAIFFDGRWGPVLVGYDAGTSWTDPSDDTSYLHTEFIDQDGNKFTPTNFLCAIEDAKGRFWIGTTQGIVEITDPKSVTDPNMTINRLKVPRNDGTNYADYLLETDQVNCISVDNSNRKWVATEVSGVYLISENGDKVLANYTTENSYLPSNTVYSVLCDPESNKVYFGTSVGIVSYNSTSSPSKEDYSEVYAYPNPVRPEFTGLITVTGLMDNSLVKIADAQGNVFYQGRSEGGMITWDGCNAAGERVRTGVYYVFASQSTDSDSHGVVTKILVVN